MSFLSQITKDTIHSLDQGKMGDAIAGMGGHLRDAAIRSKQALDGFSLPKKNEIENIVVAGLGGSALYTYKLRKRSPRRY